MCFWRLLHSIAIKLTNIRVLQLFLQTKFETSETRQMFSVCASSFYLQLWMHLDWNTSALDNPWNSVIMALSELKSCGFEARIFHLCLWMLSVEYSNYLCDGSKTVVLWWNISSSALTIKLSQNVLYVGGSFCFISGARIKRVVTSTPVDVFDDEVGKPSSPTVRDTHFYDVYRVKRGWKENASFLVEWGCKNSSERDLICLPWIQIHISNKYYVYHQWVLLVSIPDLVTLCGGFLTHT